MYDIISGFADDICAISCDEAFIDVSSRAKNDEDALKLAENIRSIIFSQTSCRASIGIGENLLLARLATKKAKPDGSFYLSREKFTSNLELYSVTDLPGLGHSLASKLSRINVLNCLELIKIPKNILSGVLGSKTTDVSV